MEALLIVDVQNDFLPGGALAVTEGDKIIPIINKLQEKFDFIIATQDWHPADHKSFAANHTGKKPGEVIKLGGTDQMLWPVHCVQESEGAEFHAALDRSKWKKVFRKGLNPLVDSYSGFFDNKKKEDTGLTAFLHENGITDVYVTGLAADYCVKFTVLDALKEGFDTYLIKDATKAVNLSPNDYDNALKEMNKSGAEVLLSQAVSF
ncbi:bifunctional nicotinamidase/pyrazinamidase [Echinicola sp. CAU 1574]|uniref:nicotinamidase n=1 Tax=Echinicola arenosa TaxID=2774144 RepID=A0ABR9APQ5_9BACT|nr:bifunctional nicotinamidase/pyrazinamidase [Echinicola arenosa]MBD8490766.1 bifunctional nicotinamidase/pyrazinamidase [Echinicola arenosa]